MSTLRSTTKALAFLLGALFPFAQRAFAQQVKQVWEENPPGVTFSIRTVTGRTDFRQGEKIDIELVFRSSVPQSYYLNTASYDRCGRLQMETYSLEPHDGVTDPLKEYQSLLGGLVCGGLQANPELKDEPRIVTLDLNEYVRFDEPGTYLLRVESLRVSRIWRETEAKYVRYRMESNEIMLRVHPTDEAWAAAEFSRAAQTLDSTDPQKDSESYRAACRTLRYLDNTLSVGELVGRLGREDPLCQYDFMAGLFGTRHRALALKLLEQYLIAPSQPVSSNYISTISGLAFIEQKHEPLPPFPANDEAKQKVWRAQSDAFHTAHRVLISAYLTKLEAGLPLKSDTARAVSADTLVQRIVQDGGSDTSPATMARKAMLRSELARSFAFQPAHRQSAYLEWGWRSVGGPEFLPALRTIFEKDESPDSWSKIRDRALQRIYEVAPGEGRRLILEEICRLEPRVGIGVLGLLPERSLTELEETIVTNLETIRDKPTLGTIKIHGELIERYATNAVFPRVKRLYEDQREPFGTETDLPLLVYFIRHDEPYALRAIAAAATQPCDGHCNHRVLLRVAQRARSAKLEALSLQILDRPATGFAQDAAEALAILGTPAAKEAVWKRLERWHGQWKERADELEYDPAGQNPNWGERLFGSTLLNVLMKARGWLLSGEELDKLRELCLLPHCGWQVENQKQIQQGQQRISMNTSEIKPVWWFGEMLFDSLEDVLAKVAQHPAGTEFSFSSDDPSSPESRQAKELLRTQIERLRMKFVD